MAPEYIINTKTRFGKTGNGTVSFPLDEDHNEETQKYRAWIAAGNTPDVVDDREPAPEEPAP